MAPFPLRVSEVDGRSTDFDAIHGHLPESFRAFLADLADPTATVIDVGCGTGRAALVVARHVGTVVAADRDPHALQAAAETARSNNVLNVAFFETDVDDEPWNEWAPHSVDAVTTHLSMTDETARRAFRALKPGGVFLVACFGPDQWKETGKASRHIRTPEAVDAALREAGFEVLDLLVEKTVVSFPDFRVLEEGFFGPDHPVAEFWKRDSRWTGLKTSFERGQRTFTESRVVARARKPGGGPRTRLR